jgi:AcrR family transcriptional regulator
MYATDMTTRPQRAAPLDLETIVRAAAELIEAEGFDALTMRAIAERCGVSAMSLYRHVQTKEELLLILASRALEDLELPEPGELAWKEEIAAVFRSLYMTALEHPEFSQLIATQPIDALVAQRGMEMVLATLQREGLDDEQAVNAYDVLVSFLRGFSQRHARRRGQEGPTFDRLSAMRDLRADEFPHVVKLAGPLVARDPEQHFEEGLALVLDGIEARIEANQV